MKLLVEDAVSYESCEGCCSLFEKAACGSIQITSFLGLQMELDAIFAEGEESGVAFLENRREKLQDLLSRCNFVDEEVAKFAKVSPQLWLPYTRNLVHENEHYTILVLVWQPKSASKIHSHPCDGCVITPLRGELSEKVYEPTDGSTGEESLTLTDVRHFKKGEVGFMSDLLQQYHKIESKTGCVSLHLYTPPFERCKIWVPEEELPASESKDVSDKVGEQRSYMCREVGSKLYSIKGVAPPPEDFEEYDLEHYL